MARLKIVRWVTLISWIFIELSLSDGQIVFDSPIDLALLVDGSGSIHDQHPPVWVPQLFFINRLLNRLPIGQDDVRVALVTFSDTANVRWTLERYTDRTSLLNAIESLEFTGGLSNVYDALVQTQENVFDGAVGNRPDVRDVIMIFSDGYPTKFISRTESEAMDTKSMGIEMYSIAIGAHQNHQTLGYLASTPAQAFILSQLLEETPDFNLLLARLNAAIGEEPLDPCTSSPCQNGAYCDSGEDPYGWHFYCYCPYYTPLGTFGGRLCQIAEPCVSIPCPAETRYCYRAITNDNGRYCYSRDWRLLD